MASGNSGRVMKRVDVIRVGMWLMGNKARLEKLTVAEVSKVAAEELGIDLSPYQARKMLKDLGMKCKGRTRGQGVGLIASIRTRVMAMYVGAVLEQLGCGKSAVLSRIEDGEAVTMDEAAEELKYFGKATAKLASPGR